MRFLLLAILALAACEACGPKPPKPKAEYSSSDCAELGRDGCHK